jgi:guanylate kinase
MQKNVVVIAGPSGGGKNSIIDEIIKRYSSCVRLVTATTRAMRPGEENAVDYHFLPESEFLKARDSGDIMEFRFVEKLNTYYGTYLPDIQRKIDTGKIVVAHLDIIGARYLKEHFNATTIFIQPDSFDVLEKRVRARNLGISDLEVDTRMEIARTEINEHAREYDYQVINVDGKLSETVEAVIAILKKAGYNLE